MSRRERSGKARFPRNFARRSATGTARRSDSATTSSNSIVYMLLDGETQSHTDEYVHQERRVAGTNSRHHRDRHYPAFWKLYRIGRPDEVLKKVYYKNALAITPRLPQTGWPR